MLIIDIEKIIKRNIRQSGIKILISLIALCMLINLYINHIISENSFAASRLPPADTRHNDQLYPLKYKLCFVFPAYMTIGGVEFWFRSLVPIFNSERYAIHATTMTELWRPEIADEIDNYGAYFNMRIATMQRECDALIITGHKPIKKIYPTEKHLLVIHGGSKCKWTYNYAKYYRAYDAVIGVSNDSYSIAKEPPPISAVIPSTIMEQQISPDIDKFRVCEVQLLYLGRISSEKNPDLFCEVVEHLPQNWCGLMVGPVYFAGSIPRYCNTNRIKIHGPTKETQSYLKHSSALFVASYEEGGPIVTIEAWHTETPVFMFATGLAVEYPTAVNIIPNKNMKPIEIAKFIHKSYKNSTTIHRAKKIYQENFSNNIIFNKWDSILERLFQDSNLIHPIHVDTRIGGYVVEKGRGRQLFCIDQNVTCTFGNTLHYWIQPTLHKQIIFHFEIESMYESNIELMLIAPHMQWNYTITDNKPSIFNIADIITNKISWQLTGSGFSMIIYRIELSSTTPS